MTPEEREAARRRAIEVAVANAPPLSEAVKETLRALFRQQYVQDNAYTVPTITCPRCGRRSTHPDDITNGYCGHCHDFTSPTEAGTPPAPSASDPPPSPGSAPTE